MMKYLTNFMRDEEGAGLVEYALLVALIAVLCIAAIGLLTTGLQTTFTSVAGKL